MHLGEVLCNKCGLYGRTHKNTAHTTSPSCAPSRARRCTKSSQGPACRPSLSVIHTGEASPVDGNHAVPPRPLNTHVFLLVMRGPGTLFSPPRVQRRPPLMTSTCRFATTCALGITVDIGVGSSSASGGVAGPDVARLACAWALRDIRIVRARR
ncbi:hypothetical protein K439DRAFT_314968 [Ramaria rubella]|nr:hypothetical protein K439DRAFT_314968 [Ramaria rubella]